MATAGTTDASRKGGREKVLNAAYDLFSRHGIRAVGVDTIVARAGVAKMTLYRHFSSKDELAVEFLKRREERWTVDWLQGEVTRRAQGPGARLLAIFDVFGEWFARGDFEGCTFVNFVLELSDTSDPVRVASVQHLANIRQFLSGLATEAGIDDPDAFARQWHILMKGSIVAAGEGDREAAARAKEIGALVLRERGVDPRP
jgi:AcrR family transcriptional regulator